jgi:hypothetical protein
MADVKTAKSATAKLEMRRVERVPILKRTNPERPDPKHRANVARIAMI